MDRIKKIFNANKKSILIAIALQVVLGIIFGSFWIGVAAVIGYGYGTLRENRRLLWPDDLEVTWSNFDELFSLDEQIQYIAPTIATIIIAILHWVIF